MEYKAQKIASFTLRFKINLMVVEQMQSSDSFVLQNILAGTFGLSNN